MMTYLDFAVNMIESILFAYLSLFYLEYTRIDRLLYTVGLSAVLFFVTSLANYLTIYEGLYSIIYSLIVFTFMYFFRSRNSNLHWDNLLIFSLLINILISISAETVYLFLCPFTGLTPSQISDSNWLITLFVASRCFIAIVVAAIKHLTSKYYYPEAKASVLYVLSFSAMYYIVTTIEANLFKENPEVFSVCSTNIIMFVIVMTTYIFYLRTSYANHEQCKKMDLIYQLQLVEENMELFRSKESELRIIRHDLINQFTILNEYLKKGDHETAAELISKQIEILDRSPDLIDTGYTAIDAIVSTKISKAKKEEIHTSVFIQLPELKERQEYDIAIILANLIDNAIENISSANKNLKLVIQTNEQIIITVENTTDKKEYSLNTSKSDILSHGWGLNSVINIASSYNGNLNTELYEGCFIAKVVLDHE